MDGIVPEDQDGKPEPCGSHLLADAVIVVVLVAAILLLGHFGFWPR